MLKLSSKLRRLFPVNPSETRIAFNILDAGMKPGLMIDVGAHYGESLGIFAESGWEVHAFEPDLDNRKRLEMCVAKNNKVKINTYAVSNKSENNVDFFKHRTSTGASGLLAYQSKHKYAGKVNTITLDMYIRRKNICSVDFLKIDAEGYDLFVLQGLLSLNKIRPKMIMCEFEDSKTKILGYTFHDIANFLQSHKYNLIVSEWYPIIEYGSQHYWRKFFEYPNALSDPNAWGNILALKDSNKFSQLKGLCGKIRLKKKFCRIIHDRNVKRLHIQNSQSTM